ncbi:MAG: HD-GYP domain-containing protein [Phycisphaerae bacterium]
MSTDMQILLVDEDVVARQYIRCSLEEMGYAVLEADTTSEAMGILQREPCRLVLLDVSCGSLDGVEFARALRSKELGRYVYLIMVLARNDDEMFAAAFEAGADDCTVRPLSDTRLRARLKAARRVVSIETRDVAIFAMAKMAESRDPDTGQHIDRVQNYSRLLAAALAEDSPYADRITPEFIRNIYLTSPLHDIGKVGIPDCVLLKPCRLDEREWEIMKTHAAQGASTLSAATKKFPGTEYLEIATEIALSHHERWDGTGYPQGLAGEEIPLSARIFAIADVYDALVSKRVYKGAFDHHVAVNIILNEEPGHFDPIVAETFGRISDQFHEIALRLSDVTSQPTPQMLAF